MNEILQYLTKQGECLDTAIATATKLPLKTVHAHLAEMKADNKIMLCESIRYVKGKEIKSTICRISGYIPPAKPGAKSKVQLKLS